MNCHDFEQLVALYVEEDLSPLERARVETHLRECSDCWDLAEDLKQSQAVVKSIRQDIPDAAALSALRERVLSEVSGLQSMTWFERFLFGGLRRKAALASVALVLVGSSVIWWTRAPHVAVVPATAVVRNIPVVVIPPPVPETQPQPAAEIPVRKSLRHRAPAPAPAKATEEPKQVAIKFVTDDPNIIIYWLVDEKGD